MHLGIEAPAKSSLSYANAHRPWQLFERVFYGLFEQLSGSVRVRRKFRFKHKLVSLDSSVIDLCLSVFDWAKFRRTKGAVKLHLVLDHEGYLPCYAVITDGSIHDVKVAWQIPFPAGTVVVDDRGYNDYRLFAYWTDAGVYFVTRMKDNTRFEVVEERRVPQNRNIVTDQTIRLTGVGAQDKCAHLLRRVEALREDTGETLVFLTNHHQLGASTVAAIYKRALGRGAVLQSPQAKSQDQDLRGYFVQRSQDPDLDSAHRDVVAAFPAAFFALQLESVQLGGAVAHELVYASRSTYMARRTVCRPAQSHRNTSNGTGVGLNLGQHKQQGAQS